jgi:transposase
MKVKYEKCCGLDVHKQTVVACVTLGAAGATPTTETRTFGTTTSDLQQLEAWLKANAVTAVGMESTGVYWKPIYNLLEGKFELIVANPERMKSVKGSKTDVHDAEWIGDLLRHGMLPTSYIPSQQLRDWRELTRQRTSLTEQRASLTNKIQKILEDAGIKLGDVVSDITGVSARAMLKELIDGKTDAAAIAELAKGQLRKKRDLLAKALTGSIRPVHRFLLAEMMSQIEALDETIARFDERIAEEMASCQAELDRWDEIPGIGVRTAQVVLAEVGPTLEQFKTPEQFAKWVGVSPGNNTSGGKRKSGKTTKGSPWLGKALNEAALAATRKKNSYFQAKYRSLAVRRGKKRALGAIAHKLVVTGYHMIRRKTHFEDLGGNFLDKRNHEKIKQRSVKKLNSIGYRVELVPI